MSAHLPTTMNHLALGELSRRKLLKVSESSDTLRRAVLIHNIMRSTASLPPSPTSPTPTLSPADDYHHHPASQPMSSYLPDDRFTDEPMEDEAGSPSHAGADASSEEDQDMFVFPTSAAVQEQIWLDALLDDLEDDVHVSVVPVDECDVPANDDDHHPLFATATTTCSPVPTPPSPALITYHPQAYTPDPTSPPPSPPELDAHTFDSDDDEDEGFSEDEDEDVITPSSSTEFTPSDTYFFSHLPFHRDHSSTRNSRHCQPLA